MFSDDVSPASLLGGIAGHVERVVGAGAAYALLRFGALEEGKRLGEGADPHTWQERVHMIDSMLGHPATVAQADDSEIRITVQATPLLNGHRHAAQAILVGLYEGLLTKAFGRRVELRSVEHAGTMHILHFGGE